MKTLPRILSFVLFTLLVSACGPKPAPAALHFDNPYAPQPGDSMRLVGLITLVFLYTTVLNIYERPEGIKIASWFIVTIIVSSLISRVVRSTELRLEGVQYDASAAGFIGEAAGRNALRILAIRPNTGQPAEYQRKLEEATRKLEEERRSVSHPVRFPTSAVFP